MDALASGAELTAGRAREAHGSLDDPGDDGPRARGSVYQHACWTRGERARWVAHGSFNGRARRRPARPRPQNPGVVRVRERDGEETASGPRASRAAAVVAPNDAAYVFGGSTRRNETGAAAAADAPTKKTPRRRWRPCDASTSRSWTIRSRAVIERNPPHVPSAPLAGSTRAPSGPRDGSVSRAHHRDARRRRGVRLRAPDSVRRRVRARSREPLGRRGGGPLGDLWAYDGAEGSWRRCLGRGPPGGSPRARVRDRVRHLGPLADGAAFCCGLRARGGVCHCQTTTHGSNWCPMAHAYDRREAQVCSGDIIPRGAVGHAACAVGCAGACDPLHCGSPRRLRQNNREQRRT